MRELLLVPHLTVSNALHELALVRSYAGHELVSALHQLAAEAHPTLRNIYWLASRRLCSVLSKNCWTGGTQDDKTTKLPSLQHF